MPNTWFQFKQFTIHHDRCAMKVGTDGVLLGAWAECENPSKILDIGTGSGLIALMMAQRFPKAEVTAIEIDNDAAGQAKENFESSSFSARLSIYNSPLQQFETADSFELIVCNPPFFKVSSTSNSAQRNTARQTGELELDELFSFSAKYLSANGSLALVFPIDDELFEIAKTHGFFPTRIMWLKGNVEAPAKRVFAQFGKEEVEKHEQILVLEASRNKYTPEATALLNNFYLYL